jgi:hypothetical protein
MADVSFYFTKESAILNSRIRVDLLFNNVCYVFFFQLSKIFIQRLILGNFTAQTIISGLLGLGFHHKIHCNEPKDSLRWSYNSFDFFAYSI